MDLKVFVYLVVFSLLGGLFSLIGGVFLSLREKKTMERFTRLSIPFAAGALLAAVFLDLMKEGIEISEASTVLVSAMIGMIGFFILERITHWFHHHHEEDGPAHTKKSTALLIIADTLLNALDGIAIATGFLISIPTGIVTAIAVSAHELPQEIGDFGVLLSRGLKKKKVIVVNVLSSLSTTIVAILVFMLGDSEVLPLGLLFGLSAGFLLYVAASDLIPTIHQKRAVKGKIDSSIVMLILGVLVVALAINISHKYISEGHNHDEVKSIDTVDMQDQEYHQEDEH